MGRVARFLFLAMLLLAAWDSSAQTVQFQASTSVSDDEVTAYSVVVELTTGAPLGSDLTVDITDQLTGTATSATDYGALGTTTLTFIAGSTNGATQTLTVTPLDDADQEGDETIDLVLENVTNGSLGAGTQHSSTINEDECVCAGGDLSFRRFDPIAIDGTVDDWDDVLDDPDNNVCDGALGTIEPLPDLDSPGANRDLSHFAFTWDLTYLYFYTRRAAASNPATHFIYYVDVDNDSIMEDNETVIWAEWRGTSTDIDVYVAKYVAANVGGDDMVDGGGNADGYSMPGTFTNISASADYTGKANAAGDKMEFRFPWADAPGAKGIGVTAQHAFHYHVSVSNNAPNSGSFPSGILDNAGGCDGGLGDTQFPATRIEPDDFSEYNPLETIYMAKQVSNDGNFTDTVNLTWSSVGAHTPTSVTFYDDADSSGDFSFGDTVLTDTDGDTNPDTGALALFTSTDILVEYVIDGAASGTSVVTLSASSSFNPPSIETATDTLFPKPSVRFASSSSATAGESGTHDVVLTLDFPSGGSLTADAVVTLSDLGTGTALSGTDYSTVPTSVTFPTGSGPGATQYLSIPITTDSNVEGDESIDLRITGTAGPANLGSNTNHTATITDDDTATITFQSAASASTDESTATHDVVLVVNTPPGGAIHVPITIDIIDAASGTANSATDYSAIGTQTITFPAFSADGSTQTGGPQILQDLLVEGDETLTLLLFNPGTLATLGVTTTHVATITDDDFASVQFATGSSSVAEPNSSDIVVTLDTGGATLAVELTVDIADLLTGSAPSATDYNAFPTVTLTFAVGATDGSTEVGKLITIDDTLVEIDETVDFRLQSPSGVLTLGSTTNHSATITDDETADISFQVATSSITEDPATQFVVVAFTATGTLQDDLIVDVRDLGTGTALTATDYTDFGSPLTLTFTAGTATGTTQVVAVPILEDTLIEATETVDLRLENASAPVALGANTNHVLSILDDESATVTFALSASAAAEAVGAHSIIVTLGGTPGATLGNSASVDIADLISGTATSATDYSFVSPTTVTFAAGAADGDTEVLSLPISSDLLVEGDETLDLRLQNASGSGLTLGSTTNHTATITDDEFVSVAFSAATSSVAEAVTVHNLALVISITGGATLADDETVDLSDLLSGTANSGTDYTALAAPVTVTFAAGSASGSSELVPVSILDDLLAEGDETVNLALAGPSTPMTLGAQTAHTLTITDPETPSVAFAQPTSASASESGTHTVIVTLTVPNAGTLQDAATIDVSDLFSGSADSATDYTALGTPVTLTFAAGSPDGSTQLLAIAITADTLLEGDETVDLRLSNPTGSGLILGTTTNHSATITDDESASVTFQVPVDSPSEAVGTHYVVVTLTVSSGGSIANPQTVQIADLLSGTANSASDYTLVSPATLTFPANSNDGATQRLAIPINDDSLVELTETINLRLQSPSSPITLGATTNHTSSIIDNETATLAFATATSALGESLGTLEVIVTLTATGTLQDAVTVNANDLLSGSASVGTDYSFSSPSLISFAAGSANGSTQVANITIIPDLLVEGDETVDLNLSGVTGAASLSGQITHTSTITDDEFADIVFQLATSSVVEAVTTHNLLFTLNITPGASLSTAVSVTVDDLGSSTASSASDYAAFGPVSLTFAAGTGNGVTREISLSILDDLLAEGTEFIDLTLSAPVAPLTLGATSFHRVSILDPETPEVDFQAATSASAVESGTHNVVLVLTIAGGGALGNQATVEVLDLLSGSASTGTDYSTLAAPITFTFPAGSLDGSSHIVPLAITSDSLLEGDETVDFHLQNPVGAGLILGVIATNHTATITDDETASYTFQAATSSVGEANTNHSVIVELNVSGGGTLASAGTVEVADLFTGSAGSGADYSAIGSPVSLTFTAGSSDGDTHVVSIPVLDDSLVELTETVNLRLQNASSPMTFVTSNHVVSIIDDEAATLDFQLASSSVGESAGGLSMVVVLSTTGGGTLQDAVTLDISDLLSGTADSSTDYTFASPAPLTFTAGSGNGTTRIVSLTALPDVLVEGDETANFAIQNIAGAASAGAQSNHQASIIDDEFANIVFQVATSSVVEAVTTHAFVLTMNMTIGATLASDATIVVDDLVSSTASSGADYANFGPLTVTFTAGSANGASEQSTVSILDDLLAEGTEFIDLALSSPSTALSLGATSFHQVSILDPETPEVDILLATSASGVESGTHNVILFITVAGGGALGNPATVELADVGTGTALSGTDYTALGPVTVTLPAGSVDGSTHLAPIAIISDNLLEGDETIDLRIQNPSGAGLILGAIRSTHTATITDDETANFAFQSATSAVGEAATTHTIIVRLNVSSGGTILSQATVDVSDILTGSASSGVDYSAVAAVTLTFPAGSNDGDFQTIAMPILDDTLVEGSETAIFQLSNASAPVTLGTSLHTATITDGETASVALQSASSSIAESATPAGIVVVLTTTGGGTLANAATVNVSDLLSGTANSAIDYSFGSPTVVTFFAGSGNGTTRVANVTILDDLIAEVDETVALSLSGPSSPVTLGATLAHTLSIVDDEDADISFQTATSLVGEANTTHVVVLQLNVANGGSVPGGFTVTLTDLGTGTAIVGSDYSSIAGPIVFSFPAGATDGDTQTQSISIIDDAAPEANESINLQLSSPTSPVELGTSNHAVLIQDDDFQGIITFQAGSSLTVSEATGTHYVVLELSAVGSAPIDLVVDVIDAFTGLATSGVDYAALGTAQVTFPVGSVDGDTQLLPVSIIDDPTTEGYETIDLQLNAVTGPGSLGSATAHTITINDDDGPFIDFKGSSSSTTEISVVHFATVQLIVPGGGPIGCTSVVQVSDVGTGSATASADYTFSTNTLTFGPASTSGSTQLVPITLLNDNLVESPETIDLRLSNLTPACVVIGAPTNHTVSITDDETPATLNFQFLPSVVDEDPVTHFVGVVLTMTGGTFLGTPVAVNIIDQFSGSATSGTDYVAFTVPTTVSFPIGTPTGRRFFTDVTIIEDLLGEPDEVLNLQLTTISGPATLGINTTHDITIIDDDANITFAVASSTVGESATTHEVIVSLATNAALTVDATADITEVGGTATSGSDFAAFAVTTVTFPAGSLSGSTQVVNVVIQDDTLVEPTETVLLRLSNVTGEPTLAGISNHSISITDSESASVAFATASSSLVEDPSNHSITVTLISTGTLASGITVSISDLLTGTANSATDYTALASPVLVNFAAGSANGATVTITVSVLEDLDIDGDETINLRIVSVSSPVSIGGLSNHTVTIIDDDAPYVNFVSGASSLVEANATREIVVFLTAPSGFIPSPLTVDVSDQGTGSASSASDYAAIPLTTLTFLAGSTTGTTQVLPISFFDDLVAEGSETLDLALSNISGGPNGYFGGTTAHTVTITDNDAVSATKSLLATDQAHTTGSDVTIGEVVTYQAVLSFYETAGLVNLQMQDTLPLDLSYQAGTVTITPGNAGMSIATTSTTWVAPLLQIDLTGVNNPTNGSGLDDFITVTYQAIVANSANNNHGDTKNNSLVFTDFNTSDAASVNLSIVEPQISVVKTASNITRCNGTATEPIAGDTLEYTLTVTETQGLDAFDIAISDVLSEGMAYDVSFTPTVSGAGNSIAAASTTGTGLAGDPQTLNWSLPLGNADIDISPSSTISIVYRVTVLVNVGSGQTLDNTATLGFSSLDGISAVERVQGSAPGVDDYESADSLTLSSKPAGTSFGIPASRRRSPTFIDANGNITGPGGPAVLTALDTLALVNGSGVTITGDGISGPPPAGAPDVTVAAGASATINTDGSNTFQYGTLTINPGATLTLTGDLAITLEQLVMGAGSTLILPGGSTLTVTGPCELNGGVGTGNYVTIQAGAGGYNINFNCSFIGDHVRFEDLGTGKVTFNGATALDFAIFVNGSGGTPYVCYCDTANVTWTNLAFGYGDGTVSTIETCPGSGDVIVDGYASTIANVWVGGDATDVENGGTVTWLNATPVRRLTGTLSPHADGGVQVEFSTENEIGVANFQLQRSASDDRWTTVATLLPQSAESVNGDYSQHDPAPAGNWSYRVQVNNIDRTHRWHAIGDLTIAKGGREVEGGRVKAEGGKRETSAFPLQPSAFTVTTPTYQPAHHATETPIQSGVARKATVFASGLYHAPDGNAYNLGRLLPRLPGNHIFVRGLSDFYTDTNTVWTGKLSITGEPGSAPDPKPEGILTADGYVGIFRAETDAMFSLNPLQAPGPNWYFAEPLTPTASIDLSIDLRSPQAGEATALIALRGNSPSEHDLTLAINGQTIGRAVWSGEGHRHIRFRFPAAALRDGANPITLSTSAATSTARLDYVEIHTPATPTLGASGLIVRIEHTGPLTVSFAEFATHITTHGDESSLPLNVDFPAGALIHFARHANHLDWKEQVTLAPPDLSGIDYLAVAPAELLDVLDPLLQQHENRGLRTLALSYEQVVDNYGAGIFGPSGIASLVRGSSARYLLLGAGTTYDYKRIEGRDTPLGIPTGWTHVHHGLAATDDLYSDNHRLAVGRLPARSRSELRIIVEKIRHYQPSRRAVLLSDRDDSEVGVDRFGTMQAALADSIPTALISSSNRGSTSVTAELVAAIQAGARIVAYQGHAGFNELGDRFVHVEELAQLPTSAWILSTCLTGSYSLNTETPTLARSLLNEPDAGGAMVIASTRFGHADDEHALVRQALQSLGSGTLTWGDILREIKINLSGETIEVFQLFGDPAMSAVATSDAREIHLRTPQGGSVIGGAGPLPITFDLIGDGWWDETLRISYAPVGVALWTTLLNYSVPAGQRSHTLHWSPPADGHYRIRIEVADD